MNDIFMNTVRAQPARLSIDAAIQSGTHPRAQATKGYIFATPGTIYALKAALPPGGLSQPKSIPDERIDGTAHAIYSAKIRTPRSIVISDLSRMANF